MAQRDAALPLRLDAELRAQVAAATQANGETLSEVVRRALRIYLATFEPAAANGEAPQNRPLLFCIRSEGRPALTMEQAREGDRELAMLVALRNHGVLTTEQIAALRDR